MSMLSVMKRFANEQKEDDEKVELVCYERYVRPGGIWQFNPNTDTDEQGVLHHNSVYKALWSNVPKECMEYPDYSFLEYSGGKPMSSYAPRAVILDYIIKRAEKYDALKQVVWNSWVEGVSFDKDTQKFTVKVKNLVSGDSVTEKFDYCIVATGHFNKPYMPKVPGTFTGELIHSREIRDWERFKGKTLCVVGGSYSAEDVLMQCIKFGAKRLTSCVRTNKMDYKGWPDIVDHVKGIVAFDGNTVEFGDGSKQEYDVVVMCTGYQHDFPFLDEELKLKTNNCLSTPLYDSVIFPDNPRMFYMGMQDQVYTFPYFECQALYILRVVEGKLPTPNKPTMMEGVKKWQHKETQIRNVSDFVMYQTDQMLMVGKKCGYPSYQNLNRHRIYMQWQVNKARDVITFRDERHASSHTFRLSDNVKTPWLTNFDDSLETFKKGGDVTSEGKSGKDFLPLPNEQDVLMRVTELQETVQRLVLGMTHDEENKKLREEIRAVRDALDGKNKEIQGLKRKVLQLVGLQDTGVLTANV